MSTINDIPEHIWIELILSDIRYELYVPSNKSTKKIADAYRWIKGREPYIEGHEEFQQILTTMNRDGSSQEHKKWRSVLNAYIADRTRINTKRVESDPS